jgi:hypothetical protein
MPAATRSRSGSMAGSGPGSLAAADEGGDDPMLLSQARSAGGAATHSSCPGTARTTGPLPPRTTTTTSTRPAASSSRPSVRFAPGPLDTTDDGHPLPTEARPKGGPPRGARSLARGTPWWEVNAEHAQEPLTPAHLRLLAAELGPENAPSITRLKRR